MDKVKISICHANGVEISQQTADSIKKLEGYTFPFEYMVQIYETASISHGRNACVCGKDIWHTSKEVSGFDYILFVDSDIEFEPENILQLYNQKKDIISGVTNPRGMDDKWCCGFWNGVSGSTNKDRMIDADRTDETIKVDWCGAAFLMIKNGVFNKIDHPWFYNAIVKHEGTSANTTEDVGFCMNAQDAGIDVFVYMNCVVKHWPVSALPADAEIAVRPGVLNEVKESISDIQLQVHRGNTVMMANVDMMAKAYNTLLYDYQDALLKIKELEKQLTEKN